VKGAIGVGGPLGLGGVAAKGDSAFSLSITPWLQYFPIDNLAVWARVIFWEGYFSHGTNANVLPFLVGARYYFTMEPGWIRPYAGLGLGAAVTFMAVLLVALVYAGRKGVIGWG